MENQPPVKGKQASRIHGEHKPGQPVWNIDDLPDLHGPFIRGKTPELATRFRSTVRVGEEKTCGKRLWIALLPENYSE